MSEVTTIGLDIAKMFFTLTERMSRVEQYSARGSAGENY